ncbi:MAG: hypothetical protein IIY88_02770 [Eubacterium sp.]|nr:hypothetical protein [Eubacterium sp.]
MMDLVKAVNSRFEEYEKLLLERDQLEKEAGQIWTAYVKVFGQLISDVFEQKIECIKRKKMIAYYQKALNCGEVIDPGKMSEFIEREMASYYVELKQMLEENRLCENSGTHSPYEVKRSKTLYRRLAKLIHPDINPETDRHEVLMDLWNRICIAYGHNDVKSLSELEVLVRKALKELGCGDEITVEIPDIEAKSTH